MLISNLQNFVHSKIILLLGVAPQAFGPGAPEAEAGGSHSSRPAWFTQRHHLKKRKQNNKN